ncbi:MULTISPECIES: hypothetical protein [Flavobacteriaceae]|uniref:hypothetical protein n=1 Tax=Flavobacteriaceae TaxID=49546 RepID=UPI001490BE7F|nr:MULTISPECIES: hypothetical protein [Allomuricauda]MDC6366859.1 hypothetical protein [Muricauda sp. AC10]
MRKFLVQLIVLSAVLLAVCFGLSCVKFSDGFIVHKTKDTAYKKIGWNLNLIKNKPERIKNSTIFLGSSLVQGAINDSLLVLSGVNAINMGVPHNGNEIGLYFTERLKNMSPKEIIILKGKTPFKGLHKMTPLLYTSITLLGNGQGINSDYIQFIFKKSKLCLEYLFFNLSSSETEYENYNKFLQKSYGVIYDKHEIPQHVYDYTMANFSGKKSDQYYNLYQNDFLYTNETDDNSVTNYLKVAKRRLVKKVWVESDFINNVGAQERFVQSIIQIGIDNKIAIRKIYIPKLVDVNTYSGYVRDDYQKVPSDSVGVYSLQDYGFLKSREHWADFDHLDESGANLYTQQITPFLKTN